jgi:hypothetical protein
LLDSTNNCLRKTVTDFKIKIRNVTNSKQKYLAIFLNMIGLFQNSGD